MKTIGLSTVGVICAVSALLTVPSVANAAVYNLSYSGTVTSVQLLPSFPDSSAVTVTIGEKFFGSFSIDTKPLSSEGAGDAGEYLNTLSFVLPSQNFTDKFLGRSNYLYTAFPEGNTQILGGSGGNSRLELDISTGVGEVFYPKNLFGKSGNFSYGYYDLGGFIIHGSTAIAPTSSVPEPATWGMMIVGLGLVGMAARRRRQTRGPNLSALQQLWQEAFGRPETG